MDVAVDSNRARRRRSVAGLSFLGESLLERARSTTLALLGGVAAVGLVAVGLALNQGWPPLPDSPLPERSAAELAHGGERSSTKTTEGRGGPAQRNAAPARSLPLSRAAGEGVPTPVAPSPSGVGRQLVATSVPVERESKGEGQGGGEEAPPRPAQRPQHATEPEHEAESQPSAKPVSSPLPAREADPAPPPLPSEPDPPTAVISTHPGAGNAYGKGNGNGPPDGVPPGQAKK